MSNHPSAQLNSSASGNAFPSARASIIERRTYLRPLNEDGTLFETPDQMLDRVIGHQRYLWETVVKRPLNPAEELELEELMWLMKNRLVSASGRVKWMGGTDLVKERASGAFNCSFTPVETPADLVDVFWLLLQGCGVGFKPFVGLMTGFNPKVQTVEIVPSTRKNRGGGDETTETFEDGIWTIKIGDSAKAWAKALGKLTAGKYPAHTIRIDLSQLRPGGKRLRGYGWLSSGWVPLANALEKICELLIRRGPDCLTAIDIGDIVNHLGTVLSSRRSAQIWLMDDFNPEVEDFIEAKTGRWEKGLGHREQSNNTVMFWTKPSKKRIMDILGTVLETGEPGFYNAAHAKRRAPDMMGTNPCAEILLPPKGFCNLMQVVWHRFNGNYAGLLRAQWIAGRANYRQTCVNMKDGVLQLQWDNNQHLLRLCGVSPTGYVSWDGMDNEEMMRGAAKAAIDGCDTMADELGTPRARRVTQVQPAGTSSKVLGLEGDEVHEGAHCSPSRFIYNNVNFPVGDPLVRELEAAGYETRPNPNDPTGILVRFPVAYPASPAYKQKEMQLEDGTPITVEISEESAIVQLNRYKNLMKWYVQHNASITISFDGSEIEDMADWFMENWDDYVGVSFLKRNDPTKTAKDLGFQYLPQEAISEEMYNAYVSKLLPVDLSRDLSEELVQMDDCETTGSCPIR